MPEITVTGLVVPGETIDSLLAEETYNYVKLEVADNGIGIDGDHQVRSLKFPTPGWTGSIWWHGHRTGDLQEDC